jgi:hypothetical protein
LKKSLKALAKLGLAWLLLEAVVAMKGRLALRFLELRVAQQRPFDHVSWP